MRLTGAILRFASGRFFLWQSNRKSRFLLIRSSLRAKVRRSHQSHVLALRVHFQHFQTTHAGRADFYPCLETYSGRALTVASTMDSRTRSTVYGHRACSRFVLRYHNGPTPLSSQRTHPELHGKYVLPVTLITVAMYGMICTFWGNCRAFSIARQDEARYKIDLYHPTNSLRYINAANRVATLHKCLA